MPSHQVRQNRRVEHEARPVFTPAVAAPSNEVIQREATSDAGQSIAASLETAGIGQSLEGSTRSFLEPKFGHDFANLKIHDGGRGEAGTRHSGKPTVQRDPLPAVPNYQLNSTFGQTPDPASRYRLGGDLTLHLDPQLQASIQLHTQRSFAPGLISSGIAGLGRGLPPLTPATPGATAAPSAATSPMPGSGTAAPPGSGGGNPAAPGATPELPHPGSVGDIFSAIASYPVVQQALDRLKDQAASQASRDWSRLNTGERILVVSSGIMIAAPALGFSLADPAMRANLGSILNGTPLPVPGVPWLHLETNLQADSFMVGFHVDLGHLLAPVLPGFGAGSPNAIGDPPSAQRAVQRDIGTAATNPAPDIGSSINARLGAGASLDGRALEQFSSSLGHDFSRVRIHHDSEANQLSKAVNARAFTTGQDIFFAQGTYNPDSSDGQKLLAHELTHTIQQARGPVSGTPTAGGVSLSDPNDAFEQEAYAAANSLARGERVNVGRASSGVVQRSVDNGGQMFLQRDPNPPPAAPAPTTGTGVKNTFETPPFKVPPEAVSLGPVKMQAEIKAELSFDQPTPASSSSDPGAPTQARAGVTASPTGGVGYQAEVQKEFQRRSEGALAGWKPTIKGGGKVTSNGGEIGVEGAIERDFLAGTVLSQTIKFTILGVDLKENDITFVGMSYTVALAKKFKAEFMPGIEVEVKGGIEFKFTPDWVQIGKWIAEKLAVSAAEAVVVDGAAVAASAAAIIAPVGAAAMIIAGFIQTGKNIDASRAAIGTAVRLRKQAKDYAKAYAGKLTGGSGSGPGADAAEEKIKTYQIASRKERAEACNDLKEKNGGYQKIYTDILAALRPKLFTQAVAEFETNYQAQFGIVESIGEDWGMRGVFRKDMRMILFADDE